MKTRQWLIITVHSLTENRYLCGENVHNGKHISLLLHHTYRVVYFKSHPCNSSYGAPERCTSVLSMCYLTNMEHFNMHHWSNRLWTNYGKMCNVIWMASRIVKSSHSVVCQYLVKNSCKCIKTNLKVSQIKTFNQK